MNYMPIYELGARRFIDETQRKQAFSSSIILNDPICEEEKFAAVRKNTDVQNFFAFKQIKKNA